MKKGLIITLLGSAIAIAGLALFPFFNLEELDLFPTAFDFMQGQILIIFPLLALITTIVIYAIKLRRDYSLLNIIYASFAIFFQTYIFFASISIFRTVVAIAWTGYYVSLAGYIIIILGALITIVASPSWNPSQRFLRVALLFKDSIISEKVLLEPEDITIGESVSNTFSVPASDIPAKFKLFKMSRAGKCFIGLLKNLQGIVKIGDKKTTINEYVAEQTSDVEGTNYVEIGGTDWGVVNFGAISLFFQFIVQREKAAAKKAFIFDWNLVGTLILSAVLQFSLIFASVFAWHEEPLKKKINVLLESLNVEVNKEKLEDPEMLDEGLDDDTSAKKAEGDEGKFGDPDIDPDVESKVPKRDGKLVKEIDPKKVGLNDILGNTKLGGAGALSSILGDSSDFSNKIAVAMNGTGAEFTMGHGSGGLSFKGTGKGGGGLGGYGRIYGLANVDTGGGAGLHANLGHKGRRKVGRIKLSSGSTSGFCEKSNIFKVVSRRKNAIKFCYDKALMLNPKLSGKIVVRWTIGPNGRVKNAGVLPGSTLRDKSVQSCILMRVRTMRFAKPKSGICIIRWPFIFNPG